MKLAFRSIEGPCPVQPLGLRAGCAAGGGSLDDHCSVVSHGAAACLSSNRARRVPADDDGAAKKSLLPTRPYVRHGHQLLSHGIYIERRGGDTLQPAPAFYPCSPSLRHRSPRISAHDPRFPPRSRPAASPISGFLVGPIDWLIKGGAGAADRTTVAVKSIAPRRGIG